MYKRQVSRLEAVRELEDIPFSNPYEEECPIRDLGTLGGGNHFAEFQCVERIYDQEAAGSLGLCADRILLLVHCGSRGYGQEILSRFWVPEGLADGSEQAEAYMAEHDRACLLYTSNMTGRTTAMTMISFTLSRVKTAGPRSFLDGSGTWKS